MKYDIWLTEVPGIGPRKTEYILASCGSAEECYFMKEQHLRNIYGLSDADVDAIVESRKKADPEREYERIVKTGVSFLRKDDPRFPEAFRHLSDPPHLIYFYGRLPEPERAAVAIVGSRTCSDYGRAMARTIASSLAGAGVTVISGMASGIDTAGHAGALAAGGETVAVLGCGPDICYPRSSKNIYQEIKEQGAVLSEYAPGTEPCARFFPVRNRLISALSDAVLVIEARIRSGALITADYALEQGKEIYALPGRIIDPLSGGTNRLIKQGATPIVSVEELLLDLRISDQKFHEKSEHSKNLLDKKESKVYSFLDFVPVGMDELLEQTAFPIAELSGILLSLEKRGLAEEPFPNRYRRVY